MRRASVKLRVTLYCTLVVGLIMLLVAGFVLLTTDLQLLSTSRAGLEGAVREAFDSVEYQHGQLEIDGDLDLYRNGITLVLYGPKGTLLLGSPPKGFPTAPLQSGVFQEVSGEGARWQVFDLYTGYDDSAGVWVRGVYSLDSGLSALRSAVMILLIACPLLILLAALGGYLVTRRAFRPVQRINEAVSAINSGTDLSRRIAMPGGRDEISELAHNFDLMFDRLERSFESERQFTSDVSHELRTPVSVIVSQSEYALTQPDLQGEVRDSVSSILQQARGMSALINQLLELSRAERQERILAPEPVDLAELCEAVAESLEERAAQRDIRLLLELQPVTVQGDQTLLLRLLTNLVANAIAYGKPGGYARLALAQDGTGALLTVSDDGAGISAEHLERIFDRFYRVDPARRRDGTGLGLSMVRWIARAHGGEVTVQSVPGVGSAFTVRLPFQPPAPA